MLNTRPWVQRWTAKVCKCPVLGCRYRAESWDSVARHIHATARAELVGLHHAWLKERGIGLSGAGSVRKVRESIMTDKMS